MSRHVPDWVHDRAATHPHERALVAGDERRSNAEVEAMTQAMAGGLHAERLGAGMRVATLLGDTVPAVGLIHAIRRVGATLVPLNRRAAPAELRAQVAAVDAEVLIHDGTNATTAERAVSGTVRPCRLALGRLMRGAPEDRPDPGVDPVPVRPVDLDAPATILFTSGTSGRPKAAVILHGNHVASADAWAAVLRPRRGDRWLSCLPLFHVAGLAMVMRTSRWGVPLEIHERFDAVAFDDAIDGGVTHASLVPPMLRRWLDQRRGRRAPPTLRAILLGGGPLSADLLARAAALGIPVTATYGMTETASGVAAGMISTERGADDGSDVPGLRALPGADIAIRVRPEEPGGPGEIVVAGPMVFAGYLGSTGELVPLEPAGGFATGDVGEIGTDGLLRVLDRRVDLIVSGGENVYPAQVEAVLEAHPAVAEAAVIGRPDATWGAVPVAALVLHPSVPTSDAMLASHCAERLAAYKVPVEFHRVAVMPRDAAGKLRREALRDSLRGGQT